MDWSVVIVDAKNRLRTKVMELDLDSLDISDYNKRYLSNKRSHLSASLNLYGSLLVETLERLDPQHINDLVLVDYGGGSGFLSFLALEAGFGTVVYNDIYHVSGIDVQAISAKFSLPISHIACGDIDDLVSYVRRNKLNIDAVVSYDCLEHIYDVKEHFKSLANLSDSSFTVLYGSGANIANPRYVNTVKSQQIKAEFQNSEKEWGHKERDSLEAFFDIRKRMIVEYAAELDESDVTYLASATRGLMKPEIHKAIDEYRITGEISYKISHPTNTCDPKTGNWCEHLMEFDWLTKVVSDAGFKNRILPGMYYNFSGSLARRVLVHTANLAIKLLGKNAMSIAPYYLIVGERIGRNENFQ